MVFLTADWLGNMRARRSGVLMVANLVEKRVS